MTTIYSIKSKYFFRNKLVVFVIFLSFLFNFVNVAHAQTCLGGNGIDTAIGCIPINDTNDFMGWVLGWSVGVGSGIAFLLIVYSSFIVMTSQGDPSRLKSGQELLTSAISGLIMLIFSVFILKFIGVDILGLNSFGFNN